MGQTNYIFKLVFLLPVTVFKVGKPFRLAGTMGLPVEGPLCHSREIRSHLPTNIKFKKLFDLEVICSGLNSRLVNINTVRRLDSDPERSLFSLT